MNADAVDATADRPRILVAEGDAPTRAGLRSVLDREEGLEIAGETGDIDGAVAMAKADRPDLALVAVELVGGGLEATRRIAALVPKVRIVVLTGRPSGEELVDAFLAGAAGYIGRDMDPERLPTVLKAVLAGEVALPRGHAHHLVEALRRRDVRRSELSARTDAVLTDREWEVLNLVADGVPTGEIARRLRISDVTARRHISSMLAKLGVADRASAVALLRPRARG